MTSWKPLISHVSCTHDVAFEASFYDGKTDLKAFGVVQAR